MQYAKANISLNMPTGRAPRRKPPAHSHNATGVPETKLAPPSTCCVHCSRTRRRISSHCYESSAEPSWSLALATAPPDSTGPWSVLIWELHNSPSWSPLWTGPRARLFEFPPVFGTRVHHSPLGPFVNLASVVLKSTLILVHGGISVTVIRIGIVRCA